MSGERTAEDLRSHRWFGVNDMRSFGHRSRIKQMGFSKEDFGGKPVIAILNTWSGLSPCHQHFKERVEDVKRGIYQAGGFPVELPAISLSEPFQKPTTMLYRNLLALEAEELLRSHPIDGCVLMGGCDKTTPALLMGATSMNLPAIFFPAGPMMKGNWAGQTLGSGSDTWKYWDLLRTNKITAEDWTGIEDGIARTAGHCMTMGTASTMTSAAEAMGMTLAGASSIPAAMSAHPMLAAATGRRAVEMVWEDLKPQDIISRDSVLNAVTVVLALAGSTNSVIHLLAMAQRAGVDLTLEDFDKLSRDIPVLANIRPSGAYLMDDFYDAGGLPALMKHLQQMLSTECITANGASLGENISRAKTYDDDVIRLLDNPVSDAGSLAVLKGSLAPNGCVIKAAAASKHLLQHRGPAVVFDNYDDLAARIDDPDLDVTADSVLVLRGCGPVGGPGMPEWGMLPIPKKLLAQGVTDMVRLSDARMSGTSYGTCVLHISPESSIGGPLDLLRDGDLIELDVPARRLDMLVESSELEQRRSLSRDHPPKATRGYTSMFSQHIGQADEGCDFDFLKGSGSPEPAIH
ncbi:L-arabinonate dehydratase [Arthrobacter pigmenti]